MVNRLLISKKGRAKKPQSYTSHDGRVKVAPSKAKMKERFAQDKVATYPKTKKKCRAGFGDPKKTGVCTQNTYKASGSGGMKKDGTPDMRFKANRGKVMPGKTRLIRNK